jgi:tetraacyldisaccharide 4'-kinase
VLKSFRYLLFPISIVYGAVIILRNFLFDKKLLQSSSFNFPIICVGNLAAGGTGKSPMVEYLIELLQAQYKVATLSRGYMRKTKGFAIANENTTALEIGDEPMQFHQKYPQVTVAVGEERVVAIPQLLYAKPETNVILLDDALQHRQVQAGLNILLTDYNNLFTRDFMLPTGDLRDVRLSKKRANIFVVTKCKENLTVEEQQAIVKEINPTTEQSVFFSEIIYTQPYHLFTKQKVNFDGDTHVLLVTGIANPTTVKQFLQKHVAAFDMLQFPDHHIFTVNDLNKIKQQFQQSTSENKIIITTEKDAVRLQKFEKELSDFPLYVLPIRQQIMFNQADNFNASVLNFVQSFPSKS